ncbi:hypothetical protein ACMG4P_04865 [Pseudovibrio denitrificans]|uniref:hypothetical protein n=1 Tax=Pseudovibrio denitrificans TaxID=258256 RepID=UPI0039BF4F2B
MTKTQKCMDLKGADLTKIQQVKLFFFLLVEWKRAGMTMRKSWYFAKVTLEQTREGFADPIDACDRELAHELVLSEMSYWEY